MKTVNVIAYYELKNPLYMSSDIHFRVKFIDRLKFLIFGDNSVFRIPNEQIFNHSSFIKYKEWRY